MKITQIEIYKSPVKLKAPFVTSLGAHTHAENVVVALRTNKGITGFGECSPFRPINGESMDTCFIVGQYLANGLKGKNPLDIATSSRAMDAIIYGNSSIKSAFDIALHDIAAQQAGVPLFSFLGGSNNKTLRTDYTVSMGEPQKMARDAQEILQKGFEVIKIKLGESTAKDVERVRLIREAIGEKVPLRIDANQGWSTAEAIETLQALAPYHIEYCEEPIPRWNFMELPKVREQSPIPIMADESCCDHHDARRLTDLGACDYINIKLGKSSGIHKALKIIRIAEHTGIPLQVGGFLESRLGFTASAHLALASNHIVYYDFDTPLMFEQDPVEDGIRYGSGGLVTVPEKPGLGAAVNEHYLQHLEKVIIK